MSDVSYPYCGAEQEICHDDGYGYDEDTEHQQHCRDCGKQFTYTTAVSFDYEVFCDGEHDMEHCGIDKHPRLYNCNRCDYYELRDQPTRPEGE